MVKKEPDVFTRNYQEYLQQISEIHIGYRCDLLGIEQEEGGVVVIPFFGRLYRVSGQGIVDDRGNWASYEVCVVLCRYLLLCPREMPSGREWVSYKDFRDSGPLTVFFRDNAERPIGRTFEGRVSDLEAACKPLGGQSKDMGLGYDLTVLFEALPRVPILMVFNDADEEFQAHCSILFERLAEKFLDAECLAIVGAYLSEQLTRDQAKQEQIGGSSKWAQ